MTPLVEVSVSVLAAFSSSHRVFRAFGHLLASGDGSLLCVPQVLASGDLRQVVDGCPVPWEEVWAVLDTAPRDPVQVHPEVLAQRFRSLFSIAHVGWVEDRIPPFAAGRDEAMRLVHPSGVRFARV